MNEVKAGGPRQFAPELRRAQRADQARAALYAAGALGIGTAYALSGIDLIPNRTPYIGYADETSVFLLAFAAAAALIRARPGLRHLPPWLQFRLRLLRADLGNFFFLQHRHADGFLVTGKNSGSHWLKFMLSAGIAARYGIDLPRHSSGAGAEDIIGHPSRPRRHGGVPQIGTTHTIPSALHRFIPAWAARRPPIVVMVRAIDDAMLSNYRKWRAEYRVPFSLYVQGDPLGRRFVADAWWYVHFFNRWGAWAQAEPGRVMVVRYEDLMADPRLWLSRVAAHLRLDFDEAALQAALRFTGRDAIRERQDPNAGEIIVPEAGLPRPSFTPEDRQALEAILRRYLRFPFGYA